MDDNERIYLVLMSVTEIGVFMAYVCLMSRTYIRRSSTSTQTPHDMELELSAFGPPRDRDDVDMEDVYL